MCTRFLFSSRMNNFTNMCSFALCWNHDWKGHRCFVCYWVSPPLLSRFCSHPGWWQALVLYLSHWQWGAGIWTLGGQYHLGCSGHAPAVGASCFDTWSQWWEPHFGYGVGRDQCFFSAMDSLLLMSGDGGNQKGWEGQDYKLLGGAWLAHSVEQVTLDLGS